MTAQNIYDNAEFLAGYRTLRRQVRGLAGAPEWPALRALLPDLDARRVVDLGCGFGWFSRWAAEHGAATVVGIDLSEKMLQRARADTTAASVQYRRCDLDQLDLHADSADVVFSSLALHYVHDLSRLLSTVSTALADAGRLVFSVEHPIFSAPSSQEFEVSSSGDRVWPLDNYLVEGPRMRTWFVDGVIKQHRTVAAYLNAVIDAGLAIDQIIEWGFTGAKNGAQTDIADDRHRPWFLLVAATK